MRQWLRDELDEDLSSSLRPFSAYDARCNALRRFKYRQLLRIGCRDILGDADLTVTTEELSRLADVCLGAAWRWAEEKLERRYGTPDRLRWSAHRPRRHRDGQAGRRRAQLLLGHRPDLRVRRGRSRRRAVTPEAVANGEFFAEAVRGIVGALESVTEEGHAFRVDLRLRPEGRMGALDPLPRGVSRVHRRARGALGAASAHQGPLLRRRCRCRAPLLRSDPAVRLPARPRSRDRGRDPPDEERHRPVAPRQGGASAGT